MAQYNSQLDDEPLMDGSVPISGVNNALPPNAIGQSLASNAVNRLAEMDGLNRPRPGISQTFKTPSSLDSIHHCGNGVFLWNDAVNWYTYNSKTGVNTGPLAGGPAWLHGDQIYSTVSDKVLYFSRGLQLYKFDPATNLFTVITLPAPFTGQCLYPLWGFFRLLLVGVGANGNSCLISDILAPESFNVATQTLTLDPIATDVITGWIVWQRQTLAIFRNGSTWIIETGPNLAVVNWEINRASATVGCCAHGTIVQCGVDVFFLSETGRGVYALSQVPTSDQMGVWKPISGPIKRYIDRINWTAIANARATYWNDLYLLSVPLDDSVINNFILVYSISLDAWQGLWSMDFDLNGIGYGFRDSARDRTATKTVLLYGTADGFIAHQTYPVDRQYHDLAVDGTTKIPVSQSLLTRSFTFSESINQIQPFVAKVQFLESVDPVDVTIWADRSIQLMKRNTATGDAGLSLPIPAFPFDLTTEGYFNLELSLANSGVCTELQLEFDGTDNWTVYQIKLAAFEFAPLEAT